MALTLHSHPLASFCHKVLIGLYDHELKFDHHLVDLGNAEARAAFYELSPFGKMPVLRDDERQLTISESTIILEYACPQLIPSDPDRARECRFWDRVFDTYVHHPMQKIVGDRLRPTDKRDPFGVDEAKKQLEKSYRIIDAHLDGKTWAIGDDFTLADCAAGPPLFFANKLVPFGAHAHIAAYFERLSARPSYARVLSEMQPYLHMFPG